MSVISVRGDARQLPLPDASVDLICTSPPYYVLRDYQDGGESLRGQIGNETTPQQWVDNLIDCTREMIRVLKPSGSIFVNLGDKYVADNRGSGNDAKRGLAKWAPTGPSGYPTGGMRQKSLMGLPWRYALRCIDDLGLILRAEIIWEKVNGLPESVGDRVRRSHEQWFHLVRQPRYYSAVDEIREPHNSISWLGCPQQQRVNKDRNDGGKVCATANRLGKLPGSVWSIPSQPLQLPEHLGVDHFAAYPTEWPRRIILGWTPAGICMECGEGRRPVSVGENKPTQRVHNGYTRGDPVGQRGGMKPLPLRRETTIIGYACACTPSREIEETRWDSELEEHYTVPVRKHDFAGWRPAPTRPAVVVDPFGGTGTTALVAHVLGRHGISIDLSHDYSRAAQWRTHDPGEQARALHVEKPPVQLDGQLDMLAGLT